MRAALPIECVEANPGEPAADAGVAIPAASRRAIARKAKVLVMVCNLTSSADWHVQTYSLNCSTGFGWAAIGLRLFLRSDSTEAKLHRSVCPPVHEHIKACFRSSSSSVEGRA